MAQTVQTTDDLLRADGIDPDTYDPEMDDSRDDYGDGPEFDPECQ